MACREFQRLIADLVANEIKPGEKARLERHIEGCAACRREVLICSGIVNQSKKADDVPVLTESFIENMLARVSAGSQRRRTFVFKPAFVAVGCLLLLSIAFGRFYFREHDAMVVEKVVYTTLPATLPYAEENLIDMIDDIDEESAGKLLDIILGNDFMLLSYL